MRERTTRRRYLRLAGTLGAGIAAAGCLRADQSSADGETETPSARLSYPESDRVAWHVPLGGQYNDGLAGVVSTGSGPVAFGGRAGDGWKGPWLLGRDDDGAARWEQTLETEQLLVPTDGTVLDGGQLAFSLAGYTDAIGHTFRGLLVTDPDGTVVTRTLSTDLVSNDYTITQSGDGTPVLGGRTGGGDDTAGAIRAVSTDGTTRWEHRFGAGSEGTERVTGVAEAGESVLAVGSTEKLRSETGWVATVDANGIAKLASFDTAAQSVRRADDGYLVLTDAGWHRIDASGTVQVETVFGGRPYQMASTTDGRVFVGTDQDTENAVVIATTNDGQERWRASIGGSYRETLTGVVGVADGGALAVGSTQSYRSAQQAATGTETADDGSPQPNGWLVRIDG